MENPFSYHSHIFNLSEYVCIKETTLPVFDVSKEREDVKFCTVDVDQNQDLLAEYGIMSVPTLIVFKNGEIINKSVGVISKPEILALLD